jgi:hypothetical protein
MCATVQEIMNGNHLWNDGMTKGNTICPQPFHGGDIKSIKNKILLSKMTPKCSAWYGGENMSWNMLTIIN